MTFLPVNAVHEPESQPQSSLSSMHDCVSSPSAPPELEPVVGTSSSNGADPNPGAGHLTSATVPLQARVRSPTFITTTSTTAPEDAPIMAFSHLSAARIHTPSTSASSSSAESDTETETDVYTDTDAESDAPSTVCSSLPSPPCDYQGDGALEDLKLKLEFDTAEHAMLTHSESDPGSYFPPMVVGLDGQMSAAAPAEGLTGEPLLSPHSGPGQTPPLSILYPSPRRQAQPLPEESSESASVASPISAPTTASMSVAASTSVKAPPPPALSALPTLAFAPTPDPSLPSTPRSLALHPALRKKLTLEALPSPVLVPPSPFELEPSKAAAALGIMNPTAAGSEVDIVQAAALTLAAAATASPDTPVVRPLHVDGNVDGDTDGDAGTETGAGLGERGQSPEDSPMPTLENMRAAWDARERTSIAVGVAGRLLAPSISRRRSS